MSRYPKVRLYINDTIVGEKEAGEANNCLAVFDVTYAPGNLRAVGLDANGNEVETVEIATAGAPAALRLNPDKTVMKADNQDIIFVEVEVVDKDGRVVPDAAAHVNFTINGPAQIKGAGSADLKSQELYTAPSATTWKGRALVAVKAGKKSGTSQLTATAPGLKKATLHLTAK